MRHEDALDIPDAFALRLRPNRLNCLINACGRRIAIVAIAHRARYGLDQVRWGAKIEFQRVANVERKNLFALPGDLLCQDRDITNRIVHVLETRCSKDLADGSQRLNRGHF